MKIEVAPIEPLTARKRGRGRLLMAFLISSMALGIGCKSKPEPSHSKGEEKTAELSEKDSSSESEEGVIAQAGPIKVTLKDFEYSVHLNRLVAPMDQLEAPPEYLSSRRTQMEIMENLIMDSVIARELSQRKLTLSEEEKAAGLRSEPALARFASILESPAATVEASEADAADDPLVELKKRGLERKDLEYAAEIIAGEMKLRDVFLTEISEEAVWDYFALQNDQAQVLAFSMSNSPTMGELMNVVESEPERIEAYFEKNKARWEREGVEAELDDGLRRQIAGILLAEQSVIPSVYNKMMVAIRTVQDAKGLSAAGKSKASKAARKRELEALRKGLEAQGATVFVPPLFSQINKGFIPEIGLSEEFASAIFASDLSEPISPKPILSRQKAWGFLLLEREHPSREAFEEQKDAVRAEYVEKMKGVIVAGFVQTFFGSQNPDLNFKPLIEAYGPDESRRPKREAAPEDDAQEELDE